MKRDKAKNLLLGDISLWCKVNGELRQNGETKNMIFSLPYLIAHISQYFTLQVRGVIEWFSNKKTHFKFNEWI